MSTETPVSIKLGMVKLDDLSELSPDDLWRRSMALNEQVALRVISTGKLAPVMTACPICNSTRITRFAEKYGLSVDRCDACDFRFTNPPPSAEQLELFYNSEAKQAENLVFERSRATRLPIFERRVELIARYASGGRLLDIGGAIGIFVDALQAAGAPFDVTVVDLNQDAIAKVRERHPQITALNENIFEHRQIYDIVTLWDTIEHLPDINRVAAHLLCLVRPGGHLFLSTPNMASFEHCVGLARHPQVVPIARLNYFSPGNLRQVLERHGFRVIDFLTPNGSFDVAYVKHMIEQGTADPLGLGDFLRRHLQSPGFAEEFAQLISRQGLAGNMVMIAQRPAESLG
jgi:SAM-dependent methyltransferase